MAVTPCFPETACFLRENPGIDIGLHLTITSEWDTSPSGVNTGGWGLYIKTEDMAKLGQFLLQKGNWNVKQLLPRRWIDEATNAWTTQSPESVSSGTKSKDSDWLQGYGYQMWRCRNSAFRADGANGQL